MMSSYSYLGDTWAGASRALLTEVLRDEWGFQGTVVTDSAMGNTSWMDINLALRAGGDMMLCLMGVNLDSSSNTAQQEMRRACHNILYTQANSAAVAAAADTSPYWLMLLVILDTAVISAALLVFLGRTKLKEKLNIGVKIGIVVVTAAVLALIFWACFFRSGGVAAADPNASQEPPAQSEEPAQTEEPIQSQEPTGIENLFMELSGTGADGNEWLKSRAILLNDGTWTVEFDYDAENSHIQTDNGTWTENEDGSLALTGTRDFTATLADGVYTMEVVNSETTITCVLTGSAEGASQPQDENVYALLEGSGVGEENVWLKAHVTLFKDGTFTVAVDYSAEYANVETDSGTWTENEDGSLALTGTRDFTATLADGVYTMEFVNAETSIPCSVSGTAAAGAEQPDGVFLQIDGNGTGEGNEWLKCHATLLDDGTFTISVDYSADYTNIQTDNGTWAKAEDGSLTLTGTRDFTVTLTDGVYTMEVTNAETGIVCELSGTV